jgi:lipopolysaccharide assembly protein A
MRVLMLLTSSMVFLLLFGFAIKNADVVALRYFLGFEWRAPLVIIVLIFFVAGVALGIFASLGKIYRQRREITRLKRELRGRAHMASAMTASS